MKKVKQIGAIIVIVLLIGMYIVSFVASLFDSPYANSLFMASLYCSIVIPVLLYLFIMFYKLKHRNDEMTLKDVKKMNKEFEQASDKKSISEIASRKINDKYKDKNKVTED